MSDFTKCPNCGDYDFRSFHKCKSKWKVFYDPCSEDDFSIIHAIDYQYAAENFAAEMNSDEIEVEVEPFNGGKKKTFIVTGELIPTYHAKEKK